MTPTYRYLLCDLLTDQVLADVPLTGVTFGRRISRTGSLSGTLSAPTPRLVEVAKTMHAYAGRSALWVFRDNQLWWGGIPWTVVPKQGTRGAVDVSVSAATFDSYAHRRQLYANKVYTGVDQGVIIPDLWRTIQAEASGDIGVIAEDQPTGNLRDRTYLVSEQAFVGELIEQLGDVIDGPEHTIDVYLDGEGNRVKELRVANRLGLAAARSVFRVTEWEHVADAVAGGTTFQTRGDSPDGNVGEDKEPLLSTRVVRTDLLDAGWPLLDAVSDHAGVKETATLDGHAEALAAEYGGAPPYSGYTVEVASSGWSPNKIGDAVRMKLRDAWHTDPIDVTARPVGCEVTPPSKGQPESIKLLFGEDEN